MKIRLFALFLLAAPVPVAAQQAVPDSVQAAPEDVVPAQLVEIERERSRTCVPVLARLEALNRDLDPLSRRALRLQQLDEAVALEDSSAVAPFDTADPVEAAVQQWFVEDGTLGQRWVETQDSTVLAQRRQVRTAVRERIRAAVEDIGVQGRERVAQDGNLENEARPCAGAIFVRSVVLEACAGMQSELCQAAADTAQGPFRFVAQARDIWDVEELRPWSQPGPLQLQGEGTLGGARSAVRARTGNVVVSVAVSPMIRARDELDATQVAEFDANLDSLGFTFEHPDYVMAPALEVQLGVTRPLGGETHYMLHFGDLSDPPNQVVWTVPVTGGPIQAAFPAAPGALARLSQGQTLSLTAVTIHEDTGEGAEADVVFSLPLTGVNQAPSLQALLGYMAGGQLGRDLLQIAPPTSGGE